MRPMERAARLSVATACAYEAVAIATGRVPTISHLCAGHPWLAPVMVAALAAHLRWPARPATRAPG